jgi:hypothetical protein
VVRRFNLVDILLIRKLQGQAVFLNLETNLLSRPAPLWVALIDYLSLNEGRSSTLVLDDSAAQGFVQAWDRTDRLACDVVCIAPSLGDSGARPELWHELLEHLCVERGYQGVQRVFARPLVDEVGIDVFRQVGFATYARRHIFRLDRIPQRLHAPDAPLLRPLERGDEWPLQRLRGSLTPRPVQQAEGGIKEDSDFASLAPWWRSPAVKEYVWAGQDEIRAYLRIVTGAEGHWLRMVLGPGGEGEADRLLSEALLRVSRYSPRPVYCGVREYEGGLQAALREFGFTACVSELLMVKQTTARIGVKVGKLSPALEKQVETATPISTSEGRCATDTAEWSR